MLLSVLSLIFVKRSSHNCTIEEGHTHKEKRWNFRILFLLLCLDENLAKIDWYQRNNPLLVLDILLAHHGVGLSSTRLAISKDADIVTLKGVQQHFLPNVFVDEHL